MARAIDSTTTVCGIILHPAGHTRSPAIHNAAFQELGIDAVYHAFDVQPDGLEAAVAGMRALGLRQLAVSIPHKEAVMPLLDRLDDEARKIGAVNTITLHEGTLVGSNTDWIGAIQAIRREIEPEGQDAAVLGAGGAARAVVHGLLRAGARVTVLNRTRTKAESLARELGAQDSGTLDDLGDLTPSIIFNTTSVGLRSEQSPVVADSIPSNAVVLDAVYDPQKTRMLRDAAGRGARTVAGKWMLVYQAAEQFRLWTNQEAPVETMARAFDGATPDP